MSEKTRQMLEKAPRPLKWTVVFAVLTVVMLATYSILPAIALGLSVGLYLGNYYGRSSVMDAWLNELKEESEELDAKLTSLKETERERTQRQEVYSDKQHWSH